MASGNYAKKPLPSASTDASSPIPARATKRLSLVTKDPDTETITFSRDSASVRPITTDQRETLKPRAGNTTTLPNTTRTPKSTEITTLPNTTTRIPKSANTTTLPNTTTRIPKSANTSRLPNSQNTATRTVTKKKSENNTVMLPEIKMGKPTRSLAESKSENITSILPETKGENLPKVLPTTQAIRAVSIDKALTHDVPLARPLEHHRPWMKPWLICSIFAIISLLVLISAGIYQRNGNTVFNFNGGQTYDVQVGGTQAKDWQQVNPEPIKKTIKPATGPYAVLHAPTITADFINKVLAARNSPAAGKGQALYDLGVQYGIDPVFALAFFQYESGFGTAGMATTTLSLGNLRCYTGVECVTTLSSGQYAKYNTWEDGFKAWYSLIRNYYVNQLGLTTVDTIIPTYAPPADNNNDASYIATLKQSIDTWHAGIV